MGEQFVTAVNRLARIPKSVKSRWSETFAVTHDRYHTDVIAAVKSGLWRATGMGNVYVEAEDGGEKVVVEKVNYKKDPRPAVTKAIEESNKEWLRSTGWNPKTGYAYKGTNYIKINPNYIDLTSPATVAAVEDTVKRFMRLAPDYDEWRAKHVRTEGEEIAPGYYWIWGGVYSWKGHAQGKLTKKAYQMAREHIGIEDKEIEGYVSEVESDIEFRKVWEEFWRGRRK